MLSKTLTITIKIKQMNSKLMRELKQMSEVEYFTLKFHFDISEMCRSIMKRYGLLDDQMAEKLELRPSQFRYFKKCAYPFTIKDIAALQAIELELATEQIAEKIKEQIQFK